MTPRRYSMDDLTKLPNIGKETARQLYEVGIDTYDALKTIGSKEAWLKIQAIDSSACYNRLCGLEGAVQNIRWHYLHDETKQDLKKFYEAHKL